MNNFMEIDLIMGISRVLFDGFISYPPIEGGAIWKITPKGVLLDIQPPPIRYIIGIWTLYCQRILSMYGLMK